MLIICEGTKSEPRYFRGLARHLRISATKINVIGEGSDPQSIIRAAKEKIRCERRHREYFDHVFCVFDKDFHETFDTASKTANSIGVRLARSWPCFEYWLLLHFTMTRRPHSDRGGKSPAENCMIDLKKHFPSYTKANEDVFAEFSDRLNFAISNAKSSLSDAHATNEFNPSTEVHCLVSHLISLRPSILDAETT